MALQFFVGNAGSGKSYRLYQKVLKEAALSPKQQYIVLVPEQFTMQTQKDFVEMSEQHGILNIDVLSFERLAYRIFEETNAHNLPVLDEIGKIFLVRRAAGEKKDELILMKDNLSRIGYINEVKSVISELIQYDISQEQIQKILDENQNHQQLYGKVHDVAVIYQTFLDYLKDRYMTQEGLLDVLCHVVDKSAMIDGAVIVMDGFTGFTPIQKKLIEKLMHRCRDMWVSLTYDTRENIRDNLPDYHLFHMSAVMRKGLKQSAADAGIEVLEDMILPAEENYRFANNRAMKDLEKNLFRQRKEIAEYDQEAVSVHVCRNPHDEMEYIAQAIHRLVARDGYRYRDIAVVTGDLAGYVQYAERIFPEYNIPYFSDYKRNALVNPVITFIRSLMECAWKDFSYESVSRLWKCGLLPMEDEQLDVLQNYILARGIRGRKRWCEEWKSLLRGMEEEELERINVWRQQFIDPLLPFVKVFRSKRTNVRDKTAAICELLENYKIFEQLEQYAQKFEDEAEAALAREYRQMYSVVIRILDRLVELLGDDCMPGDEYARLLEAGFAETKVGIIPPGVDEVVIGDIERSRLKQVKVLFLAGVNDGVIPKGKSQAGILSDLERESLKEQGVELSPGREELYYNQRFYLYLNMTKPSDRLCISYSRVDAKGSSCNPSYLVGMIQEIFPALCLVDEEERSSDAARVEAPRMAMKYVVEHLQDEQRDETFYGLYRWLCEQELYKGRIAGLRMAYRDGKSGDKIQKALARLLYTGELTGSVTRLERYAACAYAHFLQYGIEAQHREEFGFQSLDFGNLVHQVLDAYAKELARRNLLWSEVSAQQQEEIMEQCLMLVIDRYDSSILYYTARDRYRIVRLKRILKRTIWALTSQLERGTFVPSRYELQFHNNLILSEGLQEAAHMRLRGRIDRMDICEYEDKVYVKVVDYKTGKKAFKLLNLYYGTQLQLVVYLQAAIQFEQELHRDKEVLPAGIVYYRVDDPLVEDTGKKEMQEKILSELNVDGLINEDEQVLQAMDRSFEEKTGSYESSVIPVALKKDGTLTAQSRTATEEELQVMMKFANKKMRQMGEAILQGDVSVNPYADGGSACSYCDYKSICMQKNDGRPNQYRKIEKMKDTEVYRRMCMEVREEEEEANGSTVDETTAKGH